MIENEFALPAAAGNHYKCNQQFPKANFIELHHDVRFNIQLRLSIISSLLEKKISYPHYLPEVIHVVPCKHMDHAFDGLLAPFFMNTVSLPFGGFQQSQ